MPKLTPLFSDSLALSLNDASRTDVVYFDFAKAFDRVPHQRLLVKMKSLGIVGKTHNWITAFLSGRTQRVRVEDQLSSWEAVRSGIPQGSVLGPSLFVIFINDMPNVIDSMCQLFADDAKVFRSIRSLDDNVILQNDINKLTKWSEKWQLPFNVSKCKSLHIGSSNPRHEYAMNGECLEQVRVEKDLEGVIDDRLKFRKQAAEAIKKANRILGLIKKSFVLLDKTTLPLLFNTLVRPHLEYGNVIWGPFFKEDIKSVEKVQRRATKMISCLKDASYDERLRSLNMPSLLHRRRRGDMIYTYKILTGKIDRDKDEFFKVSNATTRGHQYKIMKQAAKKNPRANYFSNRVINDWNNLPSDVIKAETTNNFKNKLDEMWTKDIYETPF